MPLFVQVGHHWVNLDRVTGVELVPDPIARDLATKAKLIADTRGVPMAQYLSDLLRPLIERDWPKALRQLEPPPPE